MATIKSHTDLPQSKKLKEFLPLESADMCYLSEESLVPKVIYNGMAFFDGKEEKLTNIIRCWSLAALLGVIPKPDLVQNSEGTWLLHSWVNDYPWSVGGYSNPVDACVEMILKLHEQNLL